MRILITGASGFIGNAIAKAARDNGHTVLSTSKTKGEQGGVGLRLGYDFSKLKFDKLKFDVLCHQAALTDTTETNAVKMNKVNFFNTQKLFEGAIDSGCRQIVYASSCAVYGDSPTPFREDGPTRPLNCYAASKLALDEWAAKLATLTGATIIGLRYSNVYGLGEWHKKNAVSMATQLYHQVRWGNPRLYKYGEQSRDWLYIKDCVQANLLAFVAKQSGVYNIGSGQPASFNQVLDLWQMATGLTRKVEYIDNPHTGKYQDKTELDITKAKTVLGYVPKYDIDEGIQDYYLDLQLKEKFGNK